MLAAAQALRVSSRRVAIQAQAPARFFTTTPVARTTVQDVTAAAATGGPLSETVQRVAETAQRVVTDRAGAEGFRAGVVYTLLAGTAATAGVLVFGPTGERTVAAGDLL